MIEGRKLIYTYSFREALDEPVRPSMADLLPLLEQARSATNVSKTDELRAGEGVHRHLASDRGALGGGQLLSQRALYSTTLVCECV